MRHALDGAVRDGSWLAAGPLDPGPHLAGSDGLFRIGNAAGEAHPIIGEGISMALQSAWLLCARLLDRYALSSRYRLRCMLPRFRRLLLVASDSSPH